MTLKEQIREIEKARIIQAMRENGWVMSKAARLLGITERMIGYRVRKYGIRKEVGYHAQESRSNEMEKITDETKNNN